MLDSSLTQHTSFPTRYRAGNKPSLLDLIITESDNNISHIGSSPPLGKSDHIVIHFNFAISPFPRSCRTTRLNYSKADYTLINEMISSIDWVDEFANLTSEQALAILDKFLCDIRCALIPEVSTIHSNRPKWLNRATKTVLNRKKRAWDRYKKNPSPVSYENYLKSRAEAASSVFSAKHNFEKKLLQGSAKNPKQLFSYINRQQSSKSPIAIQPCNGPLLTSPQDVASALNTYFHSVFQSRSFPLNAPLPPTGPFQHALSVTTDVVYQHLSALLKDCAESLCSPLTIIFNLCIKEGSFPDSWKRATVCPNP